MKGTNVGATEKERTPSLPGGRDRDSTLPAGFSAFKRKSKRRRQIQTRRTLKSEEVGKAMKATVTLKSKDVGEVKTAKKVAVLGKAKNPPEYVWCWGSLAQSIVDIQRCYRGHLARRWVCVWSTYSTAERTSCELRLASFQAYVRGYLRRKYWLQKVPILRKAVQKIQAQWRGSCVRMRHEKLVAHVTVAQSLCRRWAVTRYFKIRIKALVCMQTNIRSFIARRKCVRLRSALRIQTLARRFYSRNRFVRKREFKIILAQSTWRQYFARRQYVVQRVAVYAMQHIVRGFLCRVHFVRFRSAVYSTQTLFRNRRLHIFAKRIQRNYRDYKKGLHNVYHIHRYLKFYLMEEKIISVQSRYRGNSTRRRLCRMRMQTKAFRALVTCAKPFLACEIVERHYEFQAIRECRRHFFKTCMPFICAELPFRVEQFQLRKQEADAGAALLQKYRHKCAHILQSFFLSLVARRRWQHSKGWKSPALQPRTSASARTLGLNPGGSKNGFNNAPVFMGIQSGGFKCKMAKDVFQKAQGQASAIVTGKNEDSPGTRMEVEKLEPRIEHSTTKKTDNSLSFQIAVHKVDSLRTVENVIGKGYSYWCTIYDDKHKKLGKTIKLEKDSSPLLQWEQTFLLDLAYGRASSFLFEVYGEAVAIDSGTSKYFCGSALVRKQDVQTILEKNYGIVSFRLKAAGRKQGIEYVGGNLYVSFQLVMAAKAGENDAITYT